ncbi:MAG: hypothetical protein CVU60_17810 [Deltaproteobacteria bacterium HGW-Deltaproteobacteria-18]|jgi:hypothetical protein|nr:MAG: hypothetical protein CVU60_17810 [Deltaproteobacteria bacterium HGW-Deltaproteobacteria-18]
MWKENACCRNALTEMSLRIMEHGCVGIKKMSILTGTSCNTLKEHFRRMVGNGMLKRNGQGRGYGVK